VLFGVDSRPVDGTVMRITIDTVMIEVGSPCAGSVDCTPIPPGIARLAELLDTLTTQQSSDPACAGVVP
jgi:hypothetical protein